MAVYIAPAPESSRRAAAPADSFGISVSRPTPRRRNSQRGAGKLKTFVWLMILVASIYVGAKVVPVLASEYEFQDAMQTTARLATVNRQGPDDIRKIIAAEAEKEDIPLTADDIHVTAESGNVKISADYSVTVDLDLYQWTMNFHPSAANNALL